MSPGFSIAILVIPAHAALGRAIVFSIETLSTGFRVFAAPTAEEHAISIDPLAAKNTRGRHLASLHRSATQAEVSLSGTFSRGAPCAGDPESDRMARLPIAQKTALAAGGTRRARPCLEPSPRRWRIGSVALSSGIARQISSGPQQIEVDMLKAQVAAAPGFPRTASSPLLTSSPSRRVSNRGPRT